MQKTEKNRVEGRVLYVSDEKVVISHRHKIKASFDGGESWSEHGEIPTSLKNRVLSRSRILSRLLRLGIEYYLPMETGALVVADRRLYSHHTWAASDLGAMSGSRPLSISEYEGKLVYGEYASNRDRAPVSVWGHGIDGPAERLFLFYDIRHIHGVFKDPLDGSFWITTGDDDEESGIWRLGPDFSSCEKIVHGSQQFRAVTLLFTESHIYFGSDTPREQNYIYRMDRLGASIEKLIDVAGSVFFGCSVGGKLFFSTAVEPSSVNKSQISEIWTADEGTNWRLFECTKKDYWHPKYFQYGQIRFPVGPGDGKNLWYSEVATVGDGYCYKVPLS